MYRMMLDELGTWNIGILFADAVEKIMLILAIFLQCYNSHQWNSHTEACWQWNLQGVSKIGDS